MSFDPAAIERETLFLIKNPHFDQRPASVREFLGDGYLEIEGKVRPGLKDALIEIFGEDVDPQRIAHIQRVMFTGAIGIGKTTIASIALPYMVHWVLCLRDPQAFFNLLPGSRIAFMQMSTSENQAREVIFGDIFARIKHSPWFVNNYPHDPAFTKQIKFPKDINILPGDSAETTFEGYNILGGILDEMDSHKVTKEKDYAEDGYNTIHGRIFSRFEDRGLLFVIGQMKKQNGFAARKYKELLKDPGAKVYRMALWESFGWQKYLKPDGTRDSFWYDTRRKQIIPSGVAKLVKNENLIEIPNVYKVNFQNKPEKALKDLGGIPPTAEDPFISIPDKVDAAIQRWVDRHGTEESPVTDSPTRPQFRPWFRAQNDPRRRSVHLDIAYSAEGDALGLAMGHIPELVEREGETKPYISFDCLVRVKAQPGTEIFLSDIRRMIYELKEERGFRIVKVTMDGFQSTDTRQQLQKKKYLVDHLSVDKNTLPYEDLRDAIYEDRVEWPKYVTYLNKGDTDLVEITTTELLGLTDDGKKIDHPKDGSKDVADAMAGVVTTLMGDRTYRKGVTSLSAHRERRQLQATGTDGSGDIAGVSVGAQSWAPGLSTPVPQAGSDALGLSIPQRLKPRRGGR